MDRDFRFENDGSRKRLFALTVKLGEAELARQLPNGWTVAAALVHLAFWDLYAGALLPEWERTGVNGDSVNIGTINAAVAGLAKAIPAANIVSLVREAAETADRGAAGVTPELAGTILASGLDYLLRRSLHRDEHVNQIESALGL